MKPQVLNWWAVFEWNGEIISGLVHDNEAVTQACADYLETRTGKKYRICAVSVKKQRETK